MYTYIQYIHASNLHTVHTYITFINSYFSNSMSGKRKRRPLYGSWKLAEKFRDFDFFYINNYFHFFFFALLKTFCICPSVFNHINNIFIAEIDNNTYTRMVTFKYKYRINSLGLIKFVTVVNLLLIISRFAFLKNPFHIFWIM